MVRQAPWGIHADGETQPVTAGILVRRLGLFWFGGSFFEGDDKRRDALDKVLIEVSEQRAQGSQ